MNDLSKGKIANSILVTNYDGTSTLSRAEAVAFIANVKSNGKQEIAARPSDKTDTKELLQQYTSRFE